MNKEYKYWLYYSNNGHLSAYTAEKEIAKQFESQRNMKYYNKEKKYISREDVNMLAADHYAETLRSVKLQTQNNIIVPMILTETEWMITTAESNNLLHHFQAGVLECNPYRFNDSCLKALNNIGMVQIYNENTKFNLMHYQIIKEIKLDKTELEFKVDELQIFLNHFSKLIKMEEL